MRKRWTLLALCVIFLMGCTSTDRVNHTTTADTEAITQTVVTTTATAELPSDPIPDSIPEPEEGTEIVVRYKVNSPLAGSLQGQVEQTVRYGQNYTTRVAAIANPGYRFVGWSDGSKNLIRASECPKTDTVYTALFEYAPMELPMVHLTTETQRDVYSKTEYVGGTITVSNCDGAYAIDSLDMEIRGRGNSSWDIMEKKSYRIRLSQKQNLLGLGKASDKSWVLLACHADHSLIRNMITMNYARGLENLAFMPASTTVDLYLNGEYRGVYLLCEQNQVDSHRVDIAEEPESVFTGYFFEMSYYAKDPAFTVGERTYEIKNDLSSSEELKAKQIAYIQAVIQRCYTAVLRGDEKTVRGMIDVPSAVDAYIVEELFKNKDDGWDSFYMHYDATVEGEKLHFGPLWDFDLSGGNTNNGGDTVDGLWAGVSECITDNQWFIALMKQEWFRALVQERWNELKPTTKQIPDVIIAEGKANFNSYSRNFEKWQIFGQIINQQPPEILALTTYTEHYQYYAKWMQNRISWLDECFNHPEFVANGPIVY
ncbi:MAG: CotH kinase family protein [Clostridia bacterium]|nr:CotH kinase family protein [Clostridia bacterium]